MALLYLLKVMVDGNEDTVLVVTDLAKVEIVVVPGRENCVGKLL